MFRLFRSVAALVACLALAWVVTACAPTPQPLAAPPVDTRSAGTVKIHDGNSEDDGNANDPTVCTFHIDVPSSHSTDDTSVLNRMLGRMPNSSTHSRKYLCSSERGL